MFLAPSANVNKKYASRKAFIYRTTCPSEADSGLSLKGKVNTSKITEQMLPVSFFFLRLLFMLTLEGKLKTSVKAIEFV